MKSLEKKPADRWQSAEEMLTWLEGLATPTGGVTPTAMAPVAAVRQRPATKLAVATDAELVVRGYMNSMPFIIAYILRVAHVDAERPVGDRRRRPSRWTGGSGEPTPVRFMPMGKREEGQHVDPTH